jgi:HSP90 family molecular chaperone
VKYLDGVAEAGEFSELAELLYEQAQLAEGAALANPPDFVLRLNRLLVRLAASRSPAA